MLTAACNLACMTNEEFEHFTMHQIENLGHIPNTWPK